MTFKIVVRRLAEAELAEAFAWYELQSAGLGDQFLKQFEKNAGAIAESPERWPVYVDDVRRYVMSRFPYIVYYEIRADIVRILRVVHTSKDPERVRRLFEN